MTILLIWAITMKGEVAFFPAEKIPENRDELFAFLDPDRQPEFLLPKDDAFIFFLKAVGTFNHVVPRDAVDYYKIFTEIYQINKNELLPRDKQDP